MHNHVDKYPSRPRFEPGTPRLQAPVDTNEPSGPAYYSEITPVDSTRVHTPLHLTMLVSDT